MKKLKKLLLLPILIATLSGCNLNKKAEIMASSFIGYDIATMVVQDKMSVRNVIPWGGELHDFEPTPRDIVAINEAKLFIYTSDALEPWINNLVSQPNAIALSESYLLEPYDHEHESIPENDEHNHSSLHFWTDPTTYLQLINTIRDHVIALDPENTAYYTNNARDYYQTIELLHLSLLEYRKLIDQPTLFFAGHNALEAFADRYDLNINSLSESYKPDAEITPQQLANLISQIREQNIHYLFIEELADPKIAKQIKNELSSENYELTLLELHSYHNITKAQAKDGVTYGTLFAQNITNIKLALSN